MFNTKTHIDMYTYYFEKLNVWNESKSLFIEVNQLSLEIESENTMQLTTLMRNACLSVNKNLAEGSAFQSKERQLECTSMAYSCLMELLNLIIISHDLELIKDDRYEDLRDQIEIIAPKINALRKAQSKVLSNSNSAETMA